MFDDAGYSLPAWTDRSIALWAQHTGEYIAETAA
jgi:hypothetical protein